jgi:predicted ATPase
MLLKNLHIKSYRGIKDLALPDFSSVSLVVGANNSGKSSILEAVALLSRPLDPSQWVQVARQRDTDTELADALWSIFRSKGVLKLHDGPQISEFMEIEGQFPDGLRTMRARAVASEDWDTEESGAVTVRVTVKVNEQPAHDLVFRRGVSAQYGDGVRLFRCFAVTPITHRSGKTMVDHLSRIVDEGEKALALEMLQLFDPGIESLDVSAGRRQTIVVKHKRRGVVDLASFGDGMRRVAALALALSRAQDGVLLIDEIEAGIHPAILSEVVEKLLVAASAAAVQLIATTHSLEVVDALVAAASALGDETQSAITAYYVAERNDQRSAQRYDHERLQELREAGVDLR